MDIWDKCSFDVDIDKLKGRECYGGLDLYSSNDIAVFVLIFPPKGDDDKYYIVPYFWIPEEILKLTVNRDHAPYDVWEKQGFVKTTEGNVIHYGFIESFIEELMKLALEKRLDHGGHKVLKWMMDNIHVRTYPAGNIKPDKEKYTEKIDGVVALIMALDRSIRHEKKDSIYDNRGILIIWYD